MNSTVSSHLTNQGLKTRAIQTAVNWHKNRAFNEKPCARVQNRILPKLTVKIVKIRQLTFFLMFSLYESPAVCLTLKYWNSFRNVKRVQSRVQSPHCPKDISAYSNDIDRCVILDFRRQVAENGALLAYYAANSGNYSPTFRDNLSVPSSGVKNPRSSEQC
jgi:hypothetical protein